jgi:hypothetical protein
VREYGVNDLCPVCRARLPAGPMATLAEDSSLARAHGTLGCALWEGEADTDGAEAAFRGHRVRPELQQVQCLCNKVYCFSLGSAVCVAR